MKIQGFLKVIKGSQIVSDKFVKREFVLTDASTQYPQYISFQLTQDRCSLLDGYSEGAEVVVHFNMKGREWASPQGEVKYFNTLEAWKIERVGESPFSDEIDQFEKPIITPLDNNSGDTLSGKDDLPF